MGGDGETGGDCLDEVKVPSPLVASYRAGRGSHDYGGAPATVGDKYAFGSTEESYRVMILGCKERGRKQDGPFDHTTGKGWVKGVRGHYYDALYVKRSRVVPVIVEATGGVTRHARAHIGYLARRSSGRGAIDRTRYGSARASTTSFYVHHLRQISKAAVMYDAMAIRKQITNLKQRACGGVGGVAQAAVAREVEA